jgi:hypothetical protein
MLSPGMRFPGEWAQPDGSTRELKDSGLVAADALAEIGIVGLADAGCLVVVDEGQEGVAAPVRDLETECSREQENTTAPPAGAL